MNLRFIALYMDHDSGYKDPFRDHFNLNSRFISNYLSVQIRRFKYKTDGSYKMIGVYPSINIQHVCRIVGDKALQARITFDQDSYAQMAEYGRYEHYLQLLEEGYNVCSLHKNIPIGELLQLHDEFRKGGYKNEWLHKKKSFRDHGIEVLLNCYFTSYDFRLVMIVVDINTKTELTSGTVIRTLPDEVCYDSLFKDIVIKNDSLSITDFLDRPKFTFSLMDLHASKFSLQIIENGLKYIPYEGNMFPE